ncbi:MAG: hydantoinase/oxoprolinase family protein [Halanaerobium sp.]|nr:hydantoinase/oxoprolinase family protein [Halanaerobium sp.]
MLIGIDVGGTHTDGILFSLSEGQIELIQKFKTPTTPDILAGLLHTLEELLQHRQDRVVSRIAISSTLAANALIQGTAPPVALLLFPGPGAIPDYAFFGQENLTLKGYVDHRGRVTQEMDEAQLLSVVKETTELGFQHFAVVSKFSCRNPVLEKRAGALIKKINPEARVTEGHRLSGSLNFPRRAATACLNSAVMDIQVNLASQVEKALECHGLDLPVYLLKADGGTFPLTESLKRPIHSIQSGQSASIMGALSFAGYENGIVIDIGGTTTDLGFLSEGVPLFLPHGIKWQEYQTLVPGFLTTSLACGGDSQVHLNDGQLQIGPERLGPPAAFGGTEPTPTDALVVLGKLAAGAGGIDSAYRALQPIASRVFAGDVDACAAAVLNKFTEKVAAAVQETRNLLAGQPVFTIHELLEEFRWDNRHLWAMGGPAKALLSYLAEQLKLEASLLPHHEVANALGAALARPTAELTVRVDTDRGKLHLIEQGVERPVSQGCKLTGEDARNLALEAGMEYLKPGHRDDLTITEQEGFNVVRGFTTRGQIHQLKVQIKPASLLWEVTSR